MYLYSFGYIKKTVYLPQHIFSLSVNPKQMFRISVIMLIFKFIFGNLLAIFDWKFWKILDFVEKKF
jgi:hypothetical protein